METVGQGLKPTLPEVSGVREWSEGMSKVSKVSEWSELVRESVRA